MDSRALEMQKYIVSHEVLQFGIDYWMERLVCGVGVWIDSVILPGWSDDYRLNTAFEPAGFYRRA